MPVDRPTFSESWYRVTNLCPRLRATVQVRRQHFRGQVWHVISDPANNQFFRLNDNAYRFIGMLDGRRAVGEVWKTCSQRMGDDAPTQGEAIQLLGQLYASNLLQAELPPDAEGLFNRYQKRVRREVQGYLMNLMFVRIPIYDPDRFLDAFVGLFGRVFTWLGFALWVLLVGAGLYSLTGRFGELARSAGNILDPGNLPLLYVSTVWVKVLHEFGHAFSCKKFGRQNGSGGQVHVMGVMFLVFMPLPYVDASSTYEFRNKWQRAVVGAAGMLVELAIAAVAAMVWANTAEGAPAHAVAYNILISAGVSTLLFNGNPLLRYDGYYIMSDLLEIANLSQRAKEYIYYLVRRHAWGVRQAHSPAHTGGERLWLLFYGLASGVYRVVVCVGILLFVADKLFLVGAAMAVAAVIAWVMVPLGKFLHYLASSPELMRVRPRAALSTLAALAAVVGAVGLILAPDRARGQGVVEPVRLAVVHSEVDGLLADSMPSGQAVGPEGPALVRKVNPELSAERLRLLAQRRGLAARRAIALEAGEEAQAQAISEQLQAVDDQLAWTDKLLEALEVRAPIAGTWISPALEQKRGAYLRREDPLGLVASLDEVIIRVVVKNDLAAALIAEADAKVEIRLEGRPDLHLTGTILRILPAGQEQLPSAALGFAAGGSVETAQDDKQGTKAAEKFYEIRIVPAPASGVPLAAGQRVMVRFDMKPKPLAVQWYRSLLQLVQKRFRV